MTGARPEDIAPLYRELERRDRLTQAERQALADAVGHFSNIPPRTDIVRQGERPERSTLLLSGVVTRYAVLPDGKRQVTALHVAGDFVDLHSFPLKVMDHSIATLVPSRVAYFPHEGLERITENYPHLTRLLWLLTVIDGARHRQWLTVMGAVPALGRTAHLLCELALRIGGNGEQPPMSITLPVTQSDLAEMLGLSLVHTNRSLQALRSRGLVRWEQNTLHILNWPELIATGDFDPSFLHLERIPR